MSTDGFDGAGSPDDLQRRLVAFVRAFGLHKPDETPCGTPVPVSEAHALAVLAGEGGMSQTELGRWLRLGKSTVSRLVDQLEGRGWVRRDAGDGDARRRTVTLTSEGRKVADDIGARRAERMAQLLDRIPERERPSVLAALDVLTRAAQDG
jgi:DNA-binding MarR family transcriptional regulator